MSSISASNILYSVCSVDLLMYNKVCLNLNLKATNLNECPCTAETSETESASVHTRSQNDQVLIPSCTACPWISTRAEGHRQRMTKREREWEGEREREWLGWSDRTQRKNTTQKNKRIKKRKKKNEIKFSKNEACAVTEQQQPEWLYICLELERETGSGAVGRKLHLNCRLSVREGSSYKILDTQTFLLEIFNTKPLEKPQNQWKPRWSCQTYLCIHICV